MRVNELGRLVEQCWREIPQHYGHVELGAWQVMPNHFHGLIRIVRPGGKGVGEVINMFKGSVTRKWRQSSAGSRHDGKESATVWAPNYYDVICFDAQELAVRENYVRANPRRWALRDVPRGEFGGGFYKGDLTLLEADAPRRALRVSRRATDAEIAHVQSGLTAYEGVVYSTFFSPGERACLSTLLAGRAGVVWVLPKALPTSVPSGWTAAFLEGRALWISPFSDEMQEASRFSCEEANRLVKELCSAVDKKAGPL